MQAASAQSSLSAHAMLQCLNTDPMPSRHGASHLSIGLTCSLEEADELARPRHCILHARQQIVTLCVCTLAAGQTVLCRSAAETSLAADTGQRAKAASCNLQAAASEKPYLVVDHVPEVWDQIVHLPGPCMVACIAGWCLQAAAACAEACMQSSLAARCIRLQLQSLQPARGARSAVKQAGLAAQLLCRMHGACSF